MSWTRRAYIGPGGRRCSSWLRAAVARLFTLICVLACSVNPSRATQPAPQPIVRLVHHSLRIEGVRIHYVEAGQGDPVLLLPGWPEDWYAWRSMVPLLVAQHRRVIVVDPRGFGDSSKPSQGYDLDTVAADLHRLIEVAHLQRPGGIDVVSHDLGGWIGYALASSYPEDVRRLVLSEVTIPDRSALKPIPDDVANVKTWHFAFNRLPDLPEILTKGHERAFLDWLFDHKAVRPSAIDAAARNEYVRAFKSKGAAHAGFEFYRELFGSAGLRRMEERVRRPLPMPVLTVGAEHGVGELLHESMKDAAPDLHGALLAGCGHYLPEECPVEFSDAIERFWLLSVPDAH